MRILHIAPHLGGGLGKALAVTSNCMPDSVVQTFCLLEHPIDRRCVDMLQAQGHRVLVAMDHAHIGQLAADADVVQFEFSNHPLIYECLAHTDFPSMRTVFWSHISGLHKPYIHPGLIRQAQRFVFTSKVSLGGPHMRYLTVEEHNKLSVINSGFGFTEVPSDIGRNLRFHKPRISYLGTVSFVKMHRNFFDVFDTLDDDVYIDIYGHCDQAVKIYAKTHPHSERFVFHGETLDPDQALWNSDIFFYPLQPEHYGTGENALVEAMSMGLPCIVMNNPAEMEIITDSKTGYIVNSVEECAKRLSMLIEHPRLRRSMGKNASEYAAESRSPKHSAL